MDTPAFIKFENDSLLYNGPKDSEMIYYVPEDFFNSTSKTSIAEIVGQYVSMIGMCNWAMIDNKGKIIKSGPIEFPTMMLCKPYKIDREKNYKVGNTKPDDYRLLRFAVGDEVLSQVSVPKLVDNVELMFKMMVINAKIPKTIPYDDLWKILLENGKLNDFSYGVNYQMLGILLGDLAYSDKNPDKLYRHTDMKDPYGYELMSIKAKPKRLSPYTALTSENWDEGIRASVLLSELPEDQIPYSPIEKVISQ